MEKATLEILYKKVTEMQEDIHQIKERLFEEPTLRDDFIKRIRDIDLEPSITVSDFGKRYSLK